MSGMLNVERNRQAGLTDASRGTGHPAPGTLTPSQSQELSGSLSVTAGSRLQGSSSRENLPGPGPGLKTDYVPLRNAIGVGTWNVRTMRSVGKLEVVEHEMSRLNIRCLGLAETRWTGKGHFLPDTGCTVIYSGNDKLKAAGVAVLLDRGLGKSLLGYNPISERILTVCLAARPCNVTLIQVYAPTNQASDTTKDEFYTCCKQVYSQTPKQDIVLLCGNFNAKIDEGAPIGKRPRSQR